MPLASDLALALDPVKFAERAGIRPDPWQAGALRSTAPRMLLNCSRQSGKSTTTAVKATHTAIYEPGALVLLTARAERQSKELYRKCLDVYHATGRPVAPEAENKLELELENGSRIIALPGQEGTVRSFSAVRLLIIDEASRVPDELYRAVRPMLAVSGGRLWALSTPFGKRGWWFEAWDSVEPWERVKVPAPQCPRIAPAFLEEERRSMPAWWFNQEYLCEFEADADAVFRYDDIRAALSSEVRPLFEVA